jgi:hypothetical protein
MDSKMKAEEAKAIQKPAQEKWKKNDTHEISKIVERPDEYSVVFEEKPPIQNESLDYMNLIVNNNGL